MSNRGSSDPILTPELLKIIKIFISLSIGLVLFFSFFNSRRANNTGADQRFRMADSNRIYFLNIRAIDYEREIRKDARMTLFRHEDRAVSDQPSLDFIIILNKTKDEAYLYLEPQNLEWPIRLKAKHGETEKIFELQNGNNLKFFTYLEELKPWIMEDSQFQIQINNDWEEIWQSPSERQALKATLEDYYRLINHQ